MSEHRGPAPSWAQIDRAVQFVLARLNEAHDTVTLTPHPEARAKLDQIEAQENRVHELSAAPAARFRHPHEPPHRAEDDSERRRASFAALVEMATAFSSHPDFDADWLAEPRGQHGPTADYGNDLA